MIFALARADVRAQAVSTITTLHTFDEASPGGFPSFGLSRGSDGNFYGTTTMGGTYGIGTVFRITPGGGLTILHNFTSYEGHSPTAGVIQGTDGNFYGPAQLATGTTTNGTIFRMSPQGATSTLHLFTTATEGAAPKIGLAQGKDGNFYGATSTGGPTGYGTLFKLTTAGKLTVLHSFTSDDGGPPLYPLAQGPDGNFYGTNGTGLFRMTPDGALTNVARFGVQSGLLLGHDGNFYGTSYTGGDRGCGAVVRVTPAGERTNLYNFYFSDGYEVNGPLVQDNDGNLYGTTTGGGNPGRGTVFRCTTAGELTVLYNFSNGEPNAPILGALLGSDGTIYGLASPGYGPPNYGTFFKLTVSETHPPFFVGESPLSNGVYYLGFSEKLFDNSYFGYYTYLSDPNYLYHFDLGYEYVFDANDGNRGVYLYDFATGTFFYTSPVFAFPYLYDFSLNAVLYYYPDPHNAGRYNTDGVRYFYNYSTGKVIKK